MITSKHVKKIDHVGIAVPCLDDAIARYELLLGVKVGHIETVEAQQVRVAFFAVGESHFELLESTDPAGPIGRYLAKHRGGVHHLCVEVDDIEAVLAEYRAAGLRLIDEVPRAGAHGKLIAFVHPAATGGVLLELSQPGPIAP